MYEQYERVLASAQRAHVPLSRCGTKANAEAWGAKSTHCYTQVWRRSRQKSYAAKLGRKEGSASLAVCKQRFALRSIELIAGCRSVACSETAGKSPPTDEQICQNVAQAICLSEEEEKIGDLARKRVRVDVANKCMRTLTITSEVQDAPLHFPTSAASSKT